MSCHGASNWALFRSCAKPILQFNQSSESQRVYIVPLLPICLLLSFFLHRISIESDLEAHTSFCLQYTTCTFDIPDFIASRYGYTLTPISFLLAWYVYTIFPSAYLSGVYLPTCISSCPIVTTCIYSVYAGQYYKMNTDTVNTVSTPRGDDSNKENDPRLVNILPPPRRRSRPQQQPLASVGYQLGPPIQLTRQDLEFTIYEDETAHEMSDDGVSLLERVTGCFKWTVACDPRDVLRWVRDKGYHQRWNMDQKRRFVRFLDWMAPLVMEGGDSKGDPLMMAMDKAITRMINERFEELGLQNLALERGGPTVLFTPLEEDRHVIYRRDFTEHEQQFIDVLWPEHWAPGQES